MCSNRFDELPHRTPTKNGKQLTYSPKRARSEIMKFVSIDDDLCTLRNILLDNYYPVNLTKKVHFFTSFSNRTVRPTEETVNSVEPERTIFT